jgi:O-antigen/teichoic acid export membrane protein
MRFLPGAGAKSRRLVWVTYGFAAGASALLAAACLLGIRHFASPHSPLRLDAMQSLLFVGSVAATAIFVIQDSVLIAVRQPLWIPAENGTFGVAKIILLFVFAPVSTAFAVFGAWMIPLTLTIPVISAALFLWYLPRPERFGPGRLRRSLPFGRRARSKMIRFAAGDAFGGLFTQAWTYLPPVIITALLGAPVNALYYISFLFSSTIDQIAANYASPLTVEGAHVPAEIASLIRSTLRRIYLIVLPVVTVLVAGCPWLIQAFGARYAGAATPMRLLLLACLPKVMSTVYYAYCRIDRSTHKSAIMQGYVCVTTLAAVVVLARPFGLTGICLAVLAVQTSTGLYSAWALRRGPLRAGDPALAPGRHRRELTRTGR